MESKVVPCYSKHWDNFSFIPFVSSCKKLNENFVKPISASGSNLNGEEASLFYNEVISSPSSVLLSKPSYSKQHTQNTKKNCTSFKKHSNRTTIFHHAQDGNTEGLDYCISKGCDINIQDMYGWTPMMCSAFEGHSAVVEYLIKNGASLSIKNKQGQTALDIAITRNHKSLFILLSEGIIENVISTENKVEEAKYCDICLYSYTGPVSIHESSIPHLLSCKKDNISTFYHIPENNKGFQIMLKSGWDKNQGLGMNATGRKFPIKTVLKNDRTCIGGGKKEVPKVTHFGPNDINSVKKHNQPSVKLVREKTLKKWQVKKFESKNRQKEIDFRRQFNMEI